MNIKTILVVEDDNEFRETLRLALANANFRVLTAFDGKGVGDAMPLEGVDLVLTDVLMPDRDGIELTTDLRKSFPNLPIIAMSGGGYMSADLHLRLARLLGANATLTKPFSTSQLLETIARVQQELVA